MDTAFTRLVGCRHPLQQAAMGGVAGPSLAGAVARAGALGMLCEFGYEEPAERVRKAVDLAGDGRVGMGFFGHWVGRLRCRGTDAAGEAGPEGARVAIPRFSAVPPSRDATGHIEAMALYAGMGVGQVSSVRSAAEVVAELVAGLDA